MAENRKNCKKDKIPIKKQNVGEVWPLWLLLVVLLDPYNLL